jgi:3-hydroxybutyrate dehydrogenase
MNKTKTCLITGSTSGIGLATAKVFAAEGFNLMLNGLENHEEGSALADQLASEHNIRVGYRYADLSDPEQTKQLLNATLEQFGQIDVLVNNAGIQHTAPIDEFPDEKWEQIIAINMSTSFYTMKHCLPLMKAQGWGRVVNIASVHGLVASANKAAYCAAKHGLIGLSKVAALEYAAHNVTVNCVCPGWTDTPILTQQFHQFADDHDVSFEQAKLGLLNTKTPYPELIAPAEIGQLVYFLCTDAAKAITGSALPIDGAWTAQ